ncbi:MAG: hypothetical protein U0667_06130 [Chloroflexota bacterium]
MLAGSSIPIAAAKPQRGLDACPEVALDVADDADDGVELASGVQVQQLVGQLVVGVRHREALDDPVARGPRVHAPRGDDVLSRIHRHGPGRRRGLLDSARSDRSDASARRRRRPTRIPDDHGSAAVAAAT